MSDARVAVDDGIDAGLTWHFGNPVAEARAVANGQGVVDLRNREVIEVSGADRLTWLHSLTSQHLSDLAVGEATTALILSPTGHIEQVHTGSMVSDGRTEAVGRFLPEGVEHGRGHADEGSA